MTILAVTGNRKTENKDKNSKKILVDTKHEQNTDRGMEKHDKM